MDASGAHRTLLLRKPGMPTAKLQDGRVALLRSDAERQRFVHALNRIEGQVRGVRAMIEADRYCGDELTQIKAAVSGLARVARLLAHEHIDAANQILLDGGSKDIIGADLSTILKSIIDL